VNCVSQDATSTFDKINQMQVDEGEGANEPSMTPM
jgi:hypothetical protein